MRCAYYCTTESYKIDELARILRNDELDPKFYTDVIHIHKGYDHEEGDIFIFSYGCIAFWGFNETREIEMIESFKAAACKGFDIYLSDQCIYEYNEEQETHIEEETDTIFLGSKDTLIKLSLSHGLTQSVKLQAFEVIVDRSIETTRKLPQELSSFGKTNLSSRKLSQQIGELFAIRNSINLHSDILDMPEFFWRRPKYEPYYYMSSSYMDITPRLDILNRRLNVIHELYEILSNELKHSHSSRLEWTVIGLIVTEIFLHIIEIIRH